MGDLNVKFYMISINESNMIFFKKYLLKKRCKYSFYSSSKNNKRYIVISLNNNEIIDEKYINKENCERLFKSPEEYIEYIELLSETPNLNILISEEYHTYLMSNKNKAKELVALFFDSRKNYTKYVLVKKDLSDIKDFCKHFNIQTKEKIENNDIKYWLFENKRNTSFMLCRRANEKAISLRVNDLRFFNYLLNFDEVSEEYENKKNEELKDNVFDKNAWNANICENEKDIVDFILQNNPIGKKIKDIRAIGTTSYSIVNENNDGLIEYKLTCYEPFILTFNDKSTLELLINRNEKMIATNCIENYIVDGVTLNNFDYNIFFKSFLNKEISEIKVVSSSLNRTRYKIGKAKANCRDYKERNSIYIVFKTKDNQFLVIKSGNGANYDIYKTSKHPDLPLVKVGKELLIKSIKEIPINILNNKENEKVFGIRKIINNEPIEEFIKKDEDLFFSINKRGFDLIEYFLILNFDSRIQSCEYGDKYESGLTTLYNNECINNIIKDLENIIYKLINDIQDDTINYYKNKVQWFYSKDGETVKFLISFLNKLKEINEENIILYVN